MNRPRPTSRRLSDEELEYYGDLYVRAGLREAGVDFETFLTDPEQYLRRHGALPAGSDQDGRRNGRFLKFLRLRPAQKD